MKYMRTNLLLSIIGCLFALSSFYSYTKQVKCPAPLVEPEVLCPNDSQSFSSFIRQKLCKSLCPGVDCPKRPVVYFSDSTNFDDTVAMFTILKAPNLDLKAVYVVGNAFSSPGSGVRNVYNILDWFGRTDVQVVTGSFYSLLDEQQGRPAPAGHTFFSAVPVGDGGLLYADTMWGTAHLLPQSARHYVAKPTATAETQDDAVAIETIRKIITSSSEKVTLLSLGTLTGAFKVLNGADSSVINNVEQLIQMGGAVDVPGNLFNVPYNTGAEFNFYLDPQAAQAVFTQLTNAGIKITLDPLDATNTVPLTRAFLSRFTAEAKTPEAQFVALLLNRVADTWFEPTNLPGLFIWDATAALALIDPSVVAQKEENVGITVITEPASINTVVNEAASTVTITTRLNTNIGSTRRDPAGNRIDIIKAFDTTKAENKLIELLNSDINPTLCPLKQPVGCYRYIPFRNL